MNRKLVPLMFSALAGLPLVGALTSTQADAAKVPTHIYKGNTVNTNWGPMQVVISVKAKKILKVSVVDPTHTARSAVLAGRAVPILIQETLTAQSARIDQVSGATTVSQAYITSLESALVKAHLA